MKKWKTGTALLLSCLLLANMTACGSRKLSADAVAETNTVDTGWGIPEHSEAAAEAAYDMEAPMEEMAAAEESASMNKTAELDPDALAAAENDEKTTSKKLIRTMDMNLETTEFDELSAFIEQKVAELGGYIESSSVNGTRDSGGRSSYLTIRVPEEKLDGFEAELGNSARVLSKNTNVRDVTLQYSDLAAHIASLRIEQETLMGMLEKAEEVSDIIVIQNELTNVRYELESYESQLKVMDNQVDYSTLYVSISEVKTPTVQEKEGFFTRVKHTFARSIRNIGEGVEDFLVFVLGNIVGIILFLAIAAGILYLLRAVFRFLFRKEKSGKKVGRREKKNKSKKEEEIAASEVKDEEKTEEQQ